MPLDPVLLGIRHSVFTFATPGQDNLCPYHEVGENKTDSLSNVVRPPRPVGHRVVDLTKFERLYESIVIHSLRHELSMHECRTGSQNWCARSGLGIIDQTWKHNGCLKSFQ